MKVLVTGANGFLGSMVLQKLSEQDGITINALVREQSNISKIDHLDVHLFRENLVRPKNLAAALENVDVVFHLAAALSGSHTALMMNTVVATQNLLQAVVQSKVKRFVLVSSFSVYGLANLPAGSTVTENTPFEHKLKFRDSYAITKCRQELLTRKFCRESSIPLVILRPGVIYGPDSGLLPTQLGIRVPGICFMYVGGRNQIPFTHVANCADAVIKAGFTEGVDGETFNIIDDSLPTQRQYLKLYESVAGRIPRKIWIPLPIFNIFSAFMEWMTKRTKENIPAIITRYRMANYFRFFRFSNDHAKKKLQWFPGIPTTSGLKEALHASKSL